MPLATVGRRHIAEPDSQATDRAAGLPSRTYGIVRRTLGKLLTWNDRRRYWRQARRAVVEYIDDAPLIVMPGVLNPRLTRTGAFFVTQLHDIRPHEDVLDMGTGSGVCAVFAARYAHSVTAVDINPQAVACARANALLSGCSERIDVLHGDLFAPVRGQQFDVVLFNPPFLHGSPRDDADRAWRSTDVAERFAAQLHAHLKPGGRALVLLSTYGQSTTRFSKLFAVHRFRMRIVAERSFINETLTLLELR